MIGIDLKTPRFVLFFATIVTAALWVLSAQAESVPYFNSQVTDGSLPPMSERLPEIPLPG